MESNDMDISLTLPKWDTRSIFACLRTTRVGRIAKVRLDGSFRYFSDVQFEHVDTLQLNIQVRYLKSTAPLLILSQVARSYN